MAIRAVNRANRSQNYTLTAPIGGLNVRDSLDVMPETDAIVMDNYIPRDTEVSLRKGFREYLLIGDPIKTLIEYKKPSGNHFIGIGGGLAYDIGSSDGAIPYADVSFTENICQTAQFKDRMYVVNGVDVPKQFYTDDANNATFDDWGFTGTDLTPERIVNVAVSKQRPWFVEKGSLKVWYAELAGNVQGTLKSFDLSALVSKGGTLQAVACWTQDGGQGIDDLTVFITSEGEALVYAGSDPNNADDWALKGKYYIPKPVGYRCSMQYQGDIILITEEGYIPLANALPLQNANASKIAFSDKIRGLVLERVADNKHFSGWQSIIYPRGGYAIFNVPVREQFEQHVINTNSGAWCRFTNIRAFCWGMFGDRLYFGSDAGVYLFDEGYSDNGDYIYGHVEQAFSNLGSPNLKKIPLLNPRIKCFTKFALTIYTNMDFESRKVSYQDNIGGGGTTKWSTLSKQIGKKWSSFKLPTGTKWAALRGTISGQWIANNSTGFKASVVFKTKTRGNFIEWFNTGMRYEQGGGIL